mmetsp:Transcript_17387/g.26080  ORF Transcript_17387/g.26080 Transcript_17387/m.26080 type:complete len:636 (-) Transcript_17387:41-1948(-)
MIVFEGRPYIASRDYLMPHREPLWNDGKQTVHFNKPGHYYEGSKKWLHSMTGDDGLPVWYKVGELPSDHQAYLATGNVNETEEATILKDDKMNAVRMHDVWVEKVKMEMEALNNGKFKHFQRNCQHAAAYAVNSLAGMDEGKVAKPPNFLFRMFGYRSWIPGIEQQRMGSFMDLSRALPVTREVSDPSREALEREKRSGSANDGDGLSESIVEPSTPNYRNNNREEWAVLENGNIVAKDMKSGNLGETSETLREKIRPNSLRTDFNDTSGSNISPPLSPELSKINSYRIKIVKAIIDSAHHVVFYRIHVLPPGVEGHSSSKGDDGYYLHKRYRDFFHFDRRLRTTSKVSIPALPPKRQFTTLFSSAFDKGFVHSRRQALQRYIMELCGTPGIPEGSEFRLFFKEPAPGSVAEMTLYNGNFLIEKQPVLFLAVYDNEEDAEAKKVLDLIEMVAKHLKRRVAFARIHTLKEPETLAMLNRMCKTTLKPTSIWIFRRDFQPFQYRGDLDYDRLATYAIAYYKPTAERWKVACERCLKNARLKSKSIQLVLEYSSITWREGIVSLPSSDWVSSMASPAMQDEKRVATFTPRPDESFRYFIAITGILRQPSATCDVNGGPSSGAQFYKQAFMDRVWKTIR